MEESTTANETSETEQTFSKDIENEIDEIDDIAEPDTNDTEVIEEEQSKEESIDATEPTEGDPTTLDQTPKDTTNAINNSETTDHIIKGDEPDQESPITETPNGNEDVPETSNQDSEIPIDPIPLTESAPDNEEVVSLEPTHTTTPPPGDSEIEPITDPITDGTQMEVDSSKKPSPTTETPDDTNMSTEVVQEVKSQSIEPDDPSNDPNIPEPQESSNTDSPRTTTLQPPTEPISESQPEPASMSVESKEPLNEETPIDLDELDQPTDLPTDSPTGPPPEDTKQDEPSEIVDEQNHETPLNFDEFDQELGPSPDSKSGPTKSSESTEVSKTDETNGDPPKPSDPQKQSEPPGDIPTLPPPLPLDGESDSDGTNTRKRRRHQIDEDPADDKNGKVNQDGDHEDADNESATPPKKKMKLMESKDTVNSELNLDRLEAVFRSTDKKFQERTGDHNCSSSNHSNADEQIPSEPVYCVCRRPYREDEFMIQCDLCEEWYHGKCIGVREEDAEEIEEYDCFLCCGQRVPSKGATYGKLDARKSVKERMERAKQHRAMIHRQLDVEQMDTVRKIEKIDKLQKSKSNASTVSNISMTLSTGSATPSASKEEVDSLFVDHNKSKKPTAVHEVDHGNIQQTVYRKETIKSPQSITKRVAGTAMNRSQKTVIGQNRTTHSPSKSSVISPHNKRDRAQFEQQRHHDDGPAAKRIKRMHSPNGAGPPRHGPPGHPPSGHGPSGHGSGHKPPGIASLPSHGPPPPPLQPVPPLEMPDLNGGPPPRSPAKKPSAVLPISTEMRYNESKSHVPLHMQNRYKFASDHPFNRPPSVGHAPPPLPHQMPAHVQRRRSSNASNSGPSGSGSHSTPQRHREPHHRMKNEQHSAHSNSRSPFARRMSAHSTNHKSRSMMKPLTESQWRQRIRDKVSLTFNAKMGVLNGKKLENYLFTTYGGGSKQWDQEAMRHIVQGDDAMSRRMRRRQMADSANPHLHCAGNMYINKVLYILDKMDQFPAVLTPIRMKSIEAKDLLYLSDAKIADAISRSNPDNKMLTKLADVLAAAMNDRSTSNGASENMKYQSAAKGLAQEIIHSAQRYSGRDKKRYINKMRDLMFNLKKNRKLARNVAAGHLSPSELVKATADQLASDEILSKRKEIQEATLKDRVLKENLDKLKRDSYHVEKSRILNFEDISKRKGKDDEVDYDITTDAVLRPSGNKKKKKKQKKGKKSSGKEEDDDDSDDGDDDEESGSEDDSDDSDDDVVIAANLKKKDDAKMVQQQQIEAKKKDIGLMLSQSRASRESIKTEVDQPQIVNQQTPNEPSFETAGEAPSSAPMKQEVTSPNPPESPLSAPVKSEMLNKEETLSSPSMVIMGDDEESDDAMNEEDDDIHQVTVIGEEEEVVRGDLLNSNPVPIEKGEDDMNFDGIASGLDPVSLDDDVKDVPDSQTKLQIKSSGEFSDENEPFLEDDDHIDLTATVTPTPSAPVQSVPSVTEKVSTTSVLSPSAETRRSEPVPVPVAQPKTEVQSSSHSHSESTAESTKKSKKSSPSLLWKGTIIHNEPLDGNEEQNELCFGIKIYHLGGEFIYKLPGFAAPDEKKGKKKRNSNRNEMLMTGRIEHFELERYLLKSLQNESRKLICCKMTISKEIAEAQKLIKHLKNKERCARFKVGSKRNATFFDFYIVPPTKSNRYLNHQFVAQHFGATISSKKMWAVIVLPIQSFNAVHEKPSGHSHQSHGHRHRKKVKHTPPVLTSPAAARDKANKSGSAESVLDDHFFSILDGLESVLGVDTQLAQDPNAQSTAVNVSGIPTPHQHQAVQPVVVPEVPSDPRKRR